MKRLKILALSLTVLIALSGFVIVQKSTAVTMGTAEEIAAITGTTDVTVMTQTARMAAAQQTPIAAGAEENGTLSKMETGLLVINITGQYNGIEVANSNKIPVPASFTSFFVLTADNDIGSISLTTETFAAYTPAATNNEVENYGYVAALTVVNFESSATVETANSYETVATPKTAVQKNEVQNNGYVIVATSLGSANSVNETTIEANQNAADQFQEEAINTVAAPVQAPLAA